MDFARYTAYKAAAKAIERADGLDAHERERLRDTAEALLLTSEPDDAEPICSDVAIALSLLVIQRRWDRSSADAMWDTICDCGPPAAVRHRRMRAPTFAGAL